MQRRPRHSSPSRDLHSSSPVNFILRVNGADNADTTQTSGSPEPAPVEAALYKHKALGSGRSFRLFRLLSSSVPGSRISGTLLEFDLDSAPQYITYSYAWGNIDLETEIFIDGTTLFVNKSCAEILEDAQTSRPGSYLWVSLISPSNFSN